MLNNGDKENCSMSLSALLLKLLDAHISKINNTLFGFKIDRSQWISKAIWNQLLTEMARNPELSEKIAELMEVVILRDNTE